MPDADSGQRYLLIEVYETKRKSQNRLRPELTNKIYKTGETGIGYCLYRLVLDNDQKLGVCTGNAIDFAPLPADKQKNKDVSPHQEETTATNSSLPTACVLGGRLFGSE
jgi:hypothetical protein